MIVTVTMNPSMDKTAEANTLLPGGLNRLERIVLDAGGKGVNVSKMIAALGGKSIATGFLGGGTGREMDAMLRIPGIEPDFIWISHATRTNLKVWSEEGGITEFNEPGALNVNKYYCIMMIFSRRYVTTAVDMPPLNNPETNTTTNQLRESI